MKRILILICFIFNFLNSDSLSEANFYDKISNFTRIKNGLIFAFDNEPNIFYKATFDYVTKDFSSKLHLCSNSNRFSVNSLYRYSSGSIALIISTFKDKKHCPNENVYVVEFYDYDFSFVTCKENEIFYYKLNKCAPKCEKDRIWDEELQDCVPDCKENEIWDPKIPGCRPRKCIEYADIQRMFDCYCNSKSDNKNLKAIGSKFETNPYSFTLNGFCYVKCKDNSIVKDIVIPFGFGFNDYEGTKNNFLYFKNKCEEFDKQSQYNDNNPAQDGNSTNVNQGNNIVPGENGEPINLDDYINVDIDIIPDDHNISNGGNNNGGDNTPDKPDVPNTPDTPNTPDKPNPGDDDNKPDNPKPGTPNTPDNPNPGDNNNKPDKPKPDNPGNENNGKGDTIIIGGDGGDGGNGGPGGNGGNANLGYEKFGLVTGDGIGEYGDPKSYWNEFQKVLFKYDGLIDSVKNLKDYVDGKGIPKLNKYGAVNSCPFSEKFSGPKVKANVTYDLCKVLSPMRETFYTMFYLIFSAGFCVICFKLLAVIFMGIKS